MRSLIFFLVTLCFTSTIYASQCGGVNESPCTISAATLVGKKAQSCPAGSRFDPIDGGSCWQCPAGMNRTVFSVKGLKGCEKSAGESLKPARLSRPTGLIGTDCTGGAKLDPSGVCWSCPAGYNRTAHSVKTNRACSRYLPAQYSAARFRGSLDCPAESVFDPIDGGTCWRCPTGYQRSWSSVKAADACTTTTFAGLGAGVCKPGLSNIRGTCMQKGDCGKQGQRPCEIGERVPSCNANLKENFKQNVCEALRPGETPFLGGLTSLSEYYGDSIKSVCKDTLGSINLNDNTPIGIGAECSKMVFVGASCEYLASALGADAVATVGGLADTPRQIADAERQFNLFRKKVDTAYQSHDCKQYAETLTPAKLHGRASQRRCPGGQFWDPNGNCYSCPAGYTRTLEAVTSNRACVDKPAGEIARSGCAVFKAATQEFAKSAACAAEVLSSGAFMNQQVDFNTAGREFCMATGEFGYALTSIMIPSKSPEQKAKQITSSLDRFIQTIKRAYQRADAIKTKFDQAKTVVASGSNLASKFNSLANCRDEGSVVATYSPSAPPVPTAKPFTQMIRIPGKNYEIGKYEVSQSEWQSIMGNNPSSHTNCATCPVTKVSWEDMQRFLLKLNVKTRMQYRLPTGAEWEYACYGGVQTAYCGNNDIGSVAWYGGNMTGFDPSTVDGGKPTHPGGQKQANAYGLYDMSGNVWEATSDCYQGNCNAHTLRGGSFADKEEDLRATKLLKFQANGRSWNTGFRLARTLPDGAPVVAKVPPPPVTTPTSGAEQLCMDMTQGKVAWSKGGSTQWQPESLVKLCRGTQNARARVECFESRIQAHNKWAVAINECQSVGKAK